MLLLFLRGTLLGKVEGQLLLVSIEVVHVLTRVHNRTFESLMIKHVKADECEYLVIKYRTLWLVAF